MLKSVLFRLTHFMSHDRASVESFLRHVLWQQPGCSLWSQQQHGNLNTVRRAFINTGQTGADRHIAYALTTRSEHCERVANGTALTP